jgi:hypothetical protein
MTMTTTTTSASQQPNSAREREEDDGGGDVQWTTTEKTRMKGNDYVIDVHVLEELEEQTITHTCPLFCTVLIIKSPSY